MMACFSLAIVTPAKAGVPLPFIPAKAGIPLLSSWPKNVSGIPAFAGMTR